MLSFIPKPLRAARRPIFSLASAGLALSLSVAFAQTAPSEINAPYGQQTAPSGDASRSQTGSSESVPPATPLPQGQPSGGPLRLTTPPAIPVIPGASAGRTTSGAPVSLGPVTLQEERPEEAAMLRTVLTASVTKVQEYPIDLQTVLRLVENQNLPINRDRLADRLQRINFYRSVSDLLPDLSATYTHSRFQGVIQIFGNETIQIYQTRITPQIRARWTIYPGGQDIFNALAARRRHREARAQLSDTLQNQLTAAANEYYNLVEAQIQVANARVGIEEARSQVELNESRMRAGVGTRLDVMRARNQLAQQERQLIATQNNVSKAEQALLNRLDLDPNIALATVGAQAQPKVLVPMTMSTEDLVARAAAANPELRVMDEELKALGHEARAVLSRIVPAVTLETYQNWTGPNYENLGLGRFGGITVEANLLENLGLAIPLDYKARKLEIQRRALERKALLRDIQSRVINAFLDSRSRAEEILAAQEELSAAQEAYRLAVGRYRAGLGINVDVLDAETALNTARTNIAAAILGFNRAQVSLLEALGETSQQSLLNGIASLPKTAVPVKPPASGNAPGSPIKP